MFGRAWSKVWACDACTFAQPYACFGMYRQFVYVHYIYVVHIYDVFFCILIAGVLWPLRPAYISLGAAVYAAPVYYL